MVARIVLLVLVVVAIIYVVRLIMPGLFYNPRMRMLFSGLGLVLMQQFMRRHGMSLIGRLLAALRFFR